MEGQIIAWEQHMRIDIGRYIGAVSREVGMPEHEGKSARVIVATRTYDTTIEDLWDAITNIERIPRWFLPISGELRLGGRYQLKGNAAGTITRCTPPRDLAVTWEFAGEVSWVTVQLSQTSDNSVLLHLEHVAHVTDERWGQFGPGAVGVGFSWVSAGTSRPALPPIARPR
jgi:uncharacterized protein YndB with AHSA1/START domain